MALFLGNALPLGGSALCFLREGVAWTARVRYVAAVSVLLCWLRLYSYCDGVVERSSARSLRRAWQTEQLHIAVSCGQMRVLHLLAGWHLESAEGDVGCGV